MLERVRHAITRWAQAGPPPAPLGAPLFADHEELHDIAVHLGRTKVELDRSVLMLRSWGRDLSRRLDDSSHGLGRADELRALGETVGGLAHNLNNSLAAILAYAELLLREAHGDTQRRRLAVMRDVALEASQTVRRLQEFVSRQPQVAFGPVGLPAVIAEAVEMTAPRWRDEAQRRGVVIAVSQNIESVPPVEGIAFELRDALVRLILNAVAAMPEGGAIDIRAASEESGWVVVEVRDTGVGMAPALRERLRQGPPPGGGLAEVFETVERHGGTVGIDSEEGDGTAVRLRLHASRFQIIPPPPEMVERGRPAEDAVRLLIVDDDPRLLDVLSDVLRSEGHEVTTATSGEGALEVFDPRLHDVVMTDLGMPRMTGWEVAERVKRRSPETAVFILTGWGETVSAHDSSQFVDRVIAKPVSAESLLEQLAELRRARPPA